MATVLIGCGESPFAKVLTEQLRQTYQVYRRHKGAGIRTALRTLKPDILILCLPLPDTDGFAVLDKIRYIPPVTVALSTYVDGELTRQAEQAGIRTMMLLPTRTDDLIHRIHALQENN